MADVPGPESKPLANIAKAWDATSHDCNQSEN